MRRRSPGVETGLMRFLRQDNREYRSARVAFLTNHTGVDTQGRSAVSLLQEEKLQLAKLLVPEHGLHGTLGRGQPLAGDAGKDGALPVYSYAGVGESPPVLGEMDLALVDLQDIGVRTYTYGSSLARLVEEASWYGIPTLILDRPDPLNGDSLQGNILETGFESSVGVHPLPLRYGLTLGELALFLNAREGWQADIRVVKMEGWKRQMWYDETGLPWVRPSPAVPSLDSALAYSGTVLLEGTNLSEGRGTRLPFLFMGAPWLRTRELIAGLEKKDLGGVTFEPTTSTPWEDKHGGELCQGLRIEITDRDEVNMPLVTLELLSLVTRINKKEFQFVLPLFDRLAGTDRIRLALEAGEEVTKITAGWEEELRAFSRRRLPYLLYH